MRDPVVRCNRRESDVDLPLTLVMSADLDPGRGLMSSFTTEKRCAREIKAVTRSKPCDGLSPASALWLRRSRSSADSSSFCSRNNRT